MNIAVTGGMGSGKTQISKVLVEMLNGTLVSADMICRDILSVDRIGWRGLKKMAPADVFLADGEINRPLLREKIFSDSLFREAVDNLIHPLVRTEILGFCVKAKADSVHLVAEVPLLFEKGWQGDFDCTLLVYAPVADCIQRVMQRDLVPKAAAVKSIAAQMQIDEKVKLADFVVDNSSSFAETIEELKVFVKKHSFEYKIEDGMKNP
jgi:dephospho-CoA kinase